MVLPVQLGAQANQLIYLVFEYFQRIVGHYFQAIVGNYVQVIVVDSRDTTCVAPEVIGTIGIGPRRVNAAARIGNPVSSLYLDSNAANASRFDECANALLEAGVMTSPSEVHGALCGLLSGGFAGAAGDALSELEKSLDLPLSGPAAEYVESLYSEAAAQLALGDFSFEPMLPDDSLELDQRVEALASWCRGFLGGYAQARVSAKAADKPVAVDSAEALRDFANIAQAVADDPDEDAEGEYQELVEYLRVASMNVMADSATSILDATPSDGGRMH